MLCLRSGEGHTAGPESFVSEPLNEPRLGHPHLERGLAGGNTLLKIFSVVARGANEVLVGDIVLGLRPLNCKCRWVEHFDDVRVGLEPFFPHPGW